jgi:hypothetical protein
MKVSQEDLRVLVAIGGKYMKVITPVYWEDSELIIDRTINPAGKNKKQRFFAVMHLAYWQIRKRRKLLTILVLLSEDKNFGFNIRKL